MGADSQGKISSLFQGLRGKLSGSREVNFPVSVYGKLPIYKDFLRSSLATKEAQALKQWLDRGISHFWSANELYKPQEIYPHSLLFKFPGTGKYILGYLWGSHDEGELRFFPFTVFVMIPAGRESFPPLSVIDAMGQFITHARRIRNELAQMPSVDSFYRWVREATVPLTIRPEAELEAELEADLAQRTVLDFATGLYGEGAAADWPALVSYLKRHQDLARSDVQGVSLAVRLPSSDSGPSLSRQVQLWCEALRVGADRKQAPVNLIVPLFANQAGIMVLQRRLRPDDVFAFHPEMPGYDFIEDLRTDVPRSGAADLATLTEDSGGVSLDGILNSGLG